MKKVQETSTKKLVQESFFVLESTTHSDDT